jgi:hypothetical protein
MKLRDAVAIGLLLVAGCASIGNPGSSGEYVLIVPPLNQLGFAETDQPLNKWQNLGSFGGQIDCTSTMEAQQSTALGWYGRITQAQNYNQTQAVEILSGKCVPADALAAPQH